MYTYVSVCMKVLFNFSCRWLQGRWLSSRLVQFSRDTQVAASRIRGLGMFRAVSDADGPHSHTGISVNPHKALLLGIRGFGVPCLDLQFLEVDTQGWLRCLRQSLESR